MYFDPQDQENEPEEPSEEFQADIRNRMEQLEEGARKMGLYVEQVHVVQSPSTTILCRVMVGEMAFDDRNLNPEKFKTDMKFREATTDFDPLEAIRDQYREDLEKGIDPFGETE